MRAAFPYETRLACLKLYSDGRYSARQIRDMHKVSTASLMTWCKEAGVAKGSRLTQKQIEEKIAHWAAPLKARPANDPDNPRSVAAKDRKDRAKFGTSPEAKAKNIAAFEELGNPEEWKEAIDQHFEGTVSQLRNEDLSPEGQVNVLTLQMLLVQLKGMVASPPPVLTWSDAERVIKLTRLTLGMDKENGESTKGADLRILNAVVESGKKPKSKKPKVIEAETSEDGDWDDPEPT